MAKKCRDRDVGGASQGGRIGMEGQGLTGGTTPKSKKFTCIYTASSYLFYKYMSYLCSIGFQGLVHPRQGLYH